MAALISGDKSLDLLSLHPFSTPQNNSLVQKVRENNVGVSSLRSVGKIERVNDNNTSSAISSKEEPRVFQDVRFLYPILPTTEYDIDTQNKYVYASDRMKADPDSSQRKRQRVVKSDTQPGLQPRLSKSQNLSSWLEKPNIDKDAYAKHATTDSQTSLEGSKCDLPSTRQLFAKSSDAKFSHENLFAKSTSSTNEAQETFIGPSSSSKQSVSTDISKEDAEVKTNMNKKMLKLNSMGKLGSPPNKKITSTKELPNGTKRCSSFIKLIVVLKYGHNEEARRKFAEIVDKTPETCASLSKSRHHDREVDSANQAKSDKSVHPFFSNRQKSTADVNADVNHKGLLERNMHHRDDLQLMKCAVTPGKLRAQRQSCVEATGRIVSSTSLPSFSAGHSVRSGGSCFSWPSKANLHVRGLENAANVMPSARYLDSRLFRENRKLKDSFVTVARSDDLMTRLSKDLCFHASLDGTVTAQDHIGWKAPVREVTTGPDLLKWFSQELLASKHATFPSTQQREDTLDKEKIIKHPALERLYSEMENTLTPFDEFACESILWASKYAPKTADQVLQPENRAQILRNWLRSLTIQATQNRKSLNSAPNMINDRNSIPRRTRPKKRRKVDRLEGFIASSDEESNSREELIETAWDNSLAISTECDNKFIPTTSGCNNLSNAVLISGPHGCGKTAAVYAVAEELGFEVFEVNPGSRRTGRDLLDKVGEMAENHLVQPMTDPSVSSTIGTLGMEEPHIAKTDTVGQRSMKSFFETKIRPTKSKDQVKVNHGAGLCKSNRQVQRSAPRQQKQSLILLEEADVLFEKDKHFWPTVVSLLAYSKRPIVMTCTDERFIPHDLIKFQINLRFTPPPRDISIEYLMALAGKEGHKLGWKTISSIFDQINQDLRSCIMNLNFWCQMGIGSRKGGLDWMINRWPAGVDLDKFGRKLRVVSNNTYRKEMSLISNELCFAKTSVTFDRDCELLKDVFTNIRVDLELLYNTYGRRQSNWNSDCKQRPLQENKTTYEQILDAEIMSDVWSFADCLLEEQMEPASSFQPDKIRADAPEGVSILPAEPIENFTSFANHLAITTVLLSRQLHSNNNDADPGSIDLPIYAAAKAAQNRCQEIVVSNHGSPLTFALSPLAPDSTMYTVLTSHSQSILASEVAPYVRAISTYDQELEVQRAYRLASFGGRLTRAARSVVEGVERGKVRRDKWILGLNFIDVLQTAGPSWRQRYGIVKGGNEEEKEKDMEDFLGNRVNRSKTNEG